MLATDKVHVGGGGLAPLERNRYFYGKLLDAWHFELETNYQNAKRWLINRMVLGHGVVCGLNVVCGDDKYSIAVTPGLAIDKWGREVIVPRQTPQVRIPDDVIARAGEYRKKQNHDRICVQVMLCYHECQTDPTPVMAGDCGTVDQCQPGTIREQYRIEFTEKCEHHHNDQCRFPHVVAGGRIDYHALVRWITLERDCLERPANPCIRLAHVYLAEDMGHSCDHGNINITVRPVVYSNDVLFDILLGWQDDTYGRREK